MRGGWLPGLAAAGILVVAIAGIRTDHPATDVTEEVRTAVDTLTELGVLDGTDCPRRGCWNQPLQRWTLAVWITRALALTPNPETPAPRFVDVDPDLWWAPHLELLAATTIASGCATNPDRYCPHEPVTRAQIATTLVRAFGLPPAPPAGYTDTAGNTHATSIDALTASGIGQSCDTQPPRFCPDRPISRIQGAALLHQAMLQHPNPSSGPGRRWVSYDIPNIALQNSTSPEPTNLRTLANGPKPLLLWFWSPW